MKDPARPRESLAQLLEQLPYPVWRRGADLTISWCNPAFAHIHDLAVERVIRAVPEGRVVTTGALRSALARDHRADYTCPLTAGIFVRIVAEAAEEDRAAGRGPVAPYWRP